MTKKIIIMLIMIILVFIIILPQSPNYLTHIGIDEGVFQYEGNMILAGKTPYKDAWDHKQPLTYFIYALGSLILPQGFWGVWLMEFLFLSLAAIIALFLLFEFCTPLESLIIVLATTISLSLLNHFGTPEQLALPFSMAALLIFYRFLSTENRSKKKDYFLSAILGLITASLFFLKQSLVAVPVAIAIYYFFHIIIQKKWNSVINVGFFLLGFCLVSISILGYLFSRNALGDYWNAAYVFNFMYSRSGLIEKINSILNQLEFLTSIPVFLISLGFWIGGMIIGLFLQIPFLSRQWNKKGFSLVTLIVGLLIIGLILIRNIISGTIDLGILEITGLILGILFIAAGSLKFIVSGSSQYLQNIGNAHFIKEIYSLPTEIRGLFYVAVFLFPLVLFLNSFSGQYYSYYYLCFFPVTILLISLGVRLIKIIKIPERSHGIIINSFIIGIFFAACYTPLLQLKLQYRNSPNPGYLEAISYIKKNTLPSDKIYVWGLDTAFYGGVHRVSPSKYFYQLGAVNWEEYAQQYGVLDEILHDFQESTPIFFIIPSDIHLGNNQHDCLQAVQNRGNDQKIFLFICKNYSLDQEFGGLQLFKYRNFN